MTSFGRVRPSAISSSIGIDQLVGEAPERPLHLLGRIGVVAGRDRRVRGEHRPRPRRGDRGIEPVAVAQPGSSELERGERGVALVEVYDARLDPERAQRADAADAEQDVLREPRFGVGDVQPRGDPAIERLVLRAVGVEQEQRNPPHVHAPDPRGHVGVVDRDLDRHRLAVRPGHQRGRQPLGIGVDPVLVLPA